MTSSTPNSPKNREVAVFASGCFWCTEAVISSLRGVEKVTSGYCGGARPNPTYEVVSTGVSGHAEAVQVEFNPSIISYETLLNVFFATHDPTTLNRQGNDVGTQYRSAIFTTNEAQKKNAEAFIKKLTEEKTYNAPIVTTIEALTVFYPAEGYHQRYFYSNPDQPYCQFIISPKVAKLREKFEAYLK